MSLSDYICSQAEWRRQKAAEYPDDQRNRQSAEALESLAEYIGHDDARDLVIPLEPHLFEGQTLGGEETRRRVARYGFGYSATTVLQHRDFLAELAMTCRLDAMEFAREHGGDPTGTLDADEMGDLDIAGAQ